MGLTGGLRHDQEAMYSWGQDQDSHESLTTSTSTVDIGKKYGLSSNAFYPWREKFSDWGKASLAGSPSARTARVARKENVPSKHWWSRSPGPTIF